MPQKYTPKYPAVTLAQARERRAEAKGNYKTARRLCTTIRQVFRYAIATARAENDPTFALRDALIAPCPKTP